MRVVFACLVCAVGCGFRSPAATDANGGGDGAIEDASLIDAAPDSGPATRTRAGLIGLWEFDEPGGTTVGDTSDALVKVPLTVSAGTVTFSSGTMTPMGVAVIASGTTPHLNADVVTAQAVTLEAWVMPAQGSQGTAIAPVVVAGLSSSINARNISILQAGTRWLARVRTTADANGGPDLLSTADLTPGVMTHVVVVADATQRILYVDGKADVTGLPPGLPLGWDKNYKMVLGNELSQSRQWAGTFALVAMYQQALTSQQVMLHHDLGPSSR